MLIDIWDLIYKWEAVLIVSTLAQLNNRINYSKKMKYTLVFSYSICFVIVSFMDKTLTLPTKTDHYRKEQSK